MNIIYAFSFLLVFQLLGEITSLAFGLSVPGPVIGMLYLFLSLSLFKSLPTFMEKPADHLLKHLSLLFVPAGVGVIVHLDKIKTEWASILGVLAITTLLSLAFTATLLLALNYLLGHRQNGRARH